MFPRFVQLVSLCSNRSAFDYDKKTLVVPLFFYIEVQTPHGLMRESLVFELSFVWLTISTNFGNFK